MIPFKNVLSGLLIGSSAFLFSQKMHFGVGGGLNITTSSTALLAGSPINTLEGCAEVIDEATGQIIMYTDGKNIWNTSHILQTNAVLNTNWNSSQLAGLQSSTHAALIAPVPKTNNTKFFVFTTTAGTATTSVGSGSGYGPLRVSMVTVQSGVIPNQTFTVDPSNKNQELTPSTVLVGEKIAIVSDGNCGYWVVADGVGTYGGNATAEAPLVTAHPASSPVVNINGLGKFYAYHVTENTTTIGQLKLTEAISTFPVGGHESWGHSYGATYMTPGEYTISRGQMKFNKIGSKLACALTNMQEIQIYDFNKSTGMLINQLRLYGNNAFGGYHGNPAACYAEALPYGLEFSPNGTYLYVSTLGNVTNQGVYQFDISSGNEATIGASRKVLEYISNQSTPYYGGIHLGDDGKMYIATYGFNNIGRINFPDNLWGTSTGLPAATIGGYPATPLAPVFISGSCRLTFPAISKVSADPVLTPSITAPVSICSGTPIQVSGSFTGNVPVIKHRWILEECNQYGVPTPFGYVSPSYEINGNPGTFQFPGSNMLSCGKYYRVRLGLANPQSCIEWAETWKVIAVICTPVAPAVADVTICAGSCANLSAPPMIGVGYSWLTTVNNAEVVIGSGTSINVCPAATTTYTLKASVKGGCFSTDNITVSVVDNNPKFNTTTYHPSGANYFTVSAMAVDQNANTQPGFTYQWDIIEISPGSSVTGGYQPCWWHSPSSPETFPGYNGSTTVNCLTLPVEGHFPTYHMYKLLRSTWNSYCPVKKDSVFVTNTGSRIGNFEQESSTVVNSRSGFSFHPNPSKGLLHITMEHPADAACKIEVYDMLGKRVYMRELFDIPPSGLFADVDLTDLNLPNGLYLLNISSDHETISQRFVIEGNK